MFSSIRTALKLVGTVVDLNDRLTALEGNFDILDRAVKRQAAQVRAENSRSRKLELEIPPEELASAARAESKSPIGGVMKLTQHGR